jgi:hypothetical protein
VCGLSQQHCVLLGVDVQPIPAAAAAAGRDGRSNASKMFGDQGRELAAVLLLLLLSRLLRNLSGNTYWVYLQTMKRVTDAKDACAPALLLLLLLRFRQLLQPLPTLVPRLDWVI